MTTKPKKKAVPRSKLLRFVSIVHTLAKDYGVYDDAETSAVISYLTDVVQQKTLFRKTGRRRRHTEVQQFIAIFGAKFREMEDFEFTKKPTSVEVKGIKDCIKRIHEKQGTIQGLLNYYFDDFIPRQGPEYSRPNFKTACSMYVIDTYLAKILEVRKERKANIKRDVERNCVLRQARTLMRKLDGNPVKQEISDWITLYNEGSLPLSVLKSRVENLNEKYEQEVVAVESEK
jgi:hypothetical protein